MAIDKWIIVSGTRRFHHDSYSILYDTQTQNWTDVNSALSSSRRFHRCVKVGSQIIPFGGYYEDNKPMLANQDPMTAIDIKYIIPEWRWVMLKTYIILRQLLDGKRATFIKKPNQDNSNLNHGMM